MVFSVDLGFIFWLSIIVGIFVVSALPLHAAVRVVRGRTTIAKTVLVMILAGILVSLVNFFFAIWGGLIAFAILLLIYRKSFRLKWHKAFFVWFLHLAFVIASFLVLEKVFSTLGKVSLFFS